jgi:membrane-associated phospholipid phosphatase
MPPVTRPLQPSPLDRRFVIVGAVFMLCTALLQVVLGRRWEPWLTVPFFWPPWFFAAGAYVAFTLVRLPPDRPEWFTRQHLLDAAVYVCVLALLQGCFHASKLSIGPVRGFVWDVSLANWDRWLHGQDPWRWFQPLLLPELIQTMDQIYIGWVFVTFGFVAWTALARRTELRERARWAWILLWIFGGAVGGWLFASAGPVFFDDALRDSRFRELERYLEAAGPTVAGRLQADLWRSYTTDTSIPFGGLTAMPSLHVGAAVLMMMVAWRRHVLLGVAFAAFAVAIQIGSVVLGWHYAIDGYVGALVAVICWRVSGPIVRSSPKGNDASPAKSVGDQ